MENVKAFNDELSAIVATKPPISRAKMTTLTKKAIKGIKYYKHVVQSIEKFIQKCRPEYKVPGLYVIDSVVRQSRHQFGVEKEVFMPRLSKNIVSTFEHIYKCPVDDKPRIMRVLNLWQKNNVFPAEIVHQLMVMGGAPDPSNTDQNLASQQSQGENAKALTNVLNDLLTKPNTKGVEDLAKILTSAQRQQIQQLLEASSEAETGNASVSAGLASARQQHENNENRSSTRGPPIARGYPGGADRDVLDFDYDEKTPDDHHHHHLQMSHNRQQYAQVPHHPPSQQQQQMQNAFNPGTALTDPARLRRLEEEQKNFDQQLKQINVNEALSNVDMRLVSSLIKSTKRSRSRSRSRERKHRRHRSRDRDHRSSRRDRSRSPHGRSRRSRSRESVGGHRRHRPGMPPVKDGFISVCSKTVWVGNITAKVQPDELEDAIKSFGGTISNFNIIPPRGCAYIVMETRPEASNLLKNMKHLRLGGKNLKCDWGATKEIPNEYKETWVKEEGVYYIPYPDTIAKLEKLSDWGFVDPESIPEQLKATPQVVEQQQDQPQVMLLAAPTAPNVAAAAAAASPFALPNLNPPPVTAQQQHRFVLNQPPPHQQLRHSIAAPHHMQPIILHRQPLPPPFATTAVSTANNNNDQSTDMDIDGGGSPDIGGEIITTNSNNGDQDNRIQQQNFAPISLAQRFSGHPMPVQIRMMPGSSMPPHRMNLMPLRMSIPMMRPGVHFPQRMPGGGPPHVLAANHIPHHHMQPPASFPIRMQPMRPHMHPQQQERMPQQQEAPTMQLAHSRAAVAAIRPPNLMQLPPNNLPAASHLSADDEPERPSSSGISGDQLNDKFAPPPSQQRKLEPPIVIDDRNPPSSPMKPPSRFDAAPPATSFVPPSAIPSKTAPPRHLGIQHDHDARFGRSHPAPMLPASVSGRQAPVVPQEFSSGSASVVAQQSVVSGPNSEPLSRFRRSDNRGEDYDHRRSRDWDSSRNRESDTRRRDGDSRRSRDSWRSGDRSYRDDHSGSRSSSYRSSHDHHDRRDDRSSRYRNEDSWRGGSSPSRHRTRSPSSRRSDHRSSKRSSPSYERSRSDRDRRRDNSVDHDRRRRRHTPTYNSKSSSDHKRGDAVKEPATSASTAAPVPGAWTVVEDSDPDMIPLPVQVLNPSKDKDHRSSPREAPKPNVEVINDDVKNSDENPAPQSDDRDEGEIFDVDEENERKSTDEAAVAPLSPPAAIITKADDDLVIAEDDKPQEKPKEEDNIASSAAGEDLDKTIEEGEVRDEED